MHKLNGILHFTGQHFIFIVLIGVLLITVALASQIARLTIDTSNEGFLHPNDPILIAYNDFRDQFGRDDMLVLSVRGENVFSLSFLTKLEALHRELEDNVPHIDDITSLVAAFIHPAARQGKMPRVNPLGILVLHYALPVRRAKSPRMK